MAAPATTSVNVHIHVKFGNRRICLEGSGDATVLEYLTCHLYSEQLLLVKTPSEMQMYLKQDVRILRSGTTFAEVIPIAFPTFYLLNILHEIQYSQIPVSDTSYYKTRSPRQGMMVWN